MNFFCLACAFFAFSPGGWPTWGPFLDHVSFVVASVKSSIFLGISYSLVVNWRFAAVGRGHSTQTGLPLLYQLCVHLKGFTDSRMT